MVGTIGLPEKELKGRETLADAVHCSRCMGLMVAEQGFNSMRGSSESEVSLRRCVQCGEMIDSVILQNRRLQHKRNS